MNAYITLLSTVSYLPGVIVLHDSVKHTNTSHPFWVVVSSIIPYEVDENLKARGMHVLRLTTSIKIPFSFEKESGHWANTFDKIQLFGLTNFTKLVYLDSDMLVLRNIDELFEKNHLSAVAAGQLEHDDWIRLNSGLMVIEPECQLPGKMIGMMDRAIQDITALGSNRIGDQDIINAYYPDWPDRKNLHLDEGYNIFVSNLDAYIHKHDYAISMDGEKNIKDIYVLHFVGPKKPWMRWARSRHFLDTFKNRHDYKWEIKAFLMYTSRLKKLNILRI